MSVLAKEILTEYELARMHIEAGFEHLLKAGEFLAEVEKLAGAEQVESWLKENCSEIDTVQAAQGLKLFKGGSVTVEAQRKPEEKEVQEN